MAIQPVPATATQAVSRPQAAAPAREATERADVPEAAELPVKAAAEPAPREQIDRAMTEIRRALAPVARNLQFSLDEETGRTIVKVVDASTQEVIRQMPSEELLAITRALDKFSGLFVKQKA